MPRPRTQLKVSARQLAKLQRQLTRMAIGPDQKRVRVLVEAATGRHTLTGLAQMAGCAPSTVQLWLKRFRSRGCIGLFERKSPPGRSSPLDHPKVQARLRAGLRAGRWHSSAEVATWLERVYSIHLQTRSVQHRLKAMGWDLRRPKPTILQSTPASAAQTKARRGEYQTPEAIVSYDTGVQAAALLIQAMRQSRLGKPAGRFPKPAPIDVYLEALFDLLEAGECSLELANRFVDAVRNDWERERLSK